MEPLGFIGLSTLGSHIVIQLLAQGYRVKIFDPHHSRAVPLAELGAEPISRAVDACRPGGLVFSLVTEQALARLVVQLPTVLGEGSIHCHLSPLSQDRAHSIAQRYETVGGSFVVRRLDQEEAEPFSLGLSGSPQARKRVRSILDGVCFAGVVRSFV